MHKPRKSEVSGEQFKCWKKKIKNKRERQKQSKHKEAVSAQTTNVKIINLKRV